MNSPCQTYLCGRFTCWLLLCAACLSACNLKSKREFEKMSWMEGRWENINGNVRLAEHWERTGNKKFEVHSFMLESRDTLFEEFITVEPRGGDIRYSVQRSGEDKGRPVVYDLTRNTGELVQFENPDQDFPQRIRYRKQGADSMFVQAYGRINNAPHRREYYMSRRKAKQQ